MMVVKVMQIALQTQVCDNPTLITRDEPKTTEELWFLLIKIYLNTYMLDEQRGTLLHSGASFRGLYKLQGSEEGGETPTHILVALLFLCRGTVHPLQKASLGQNLTLCIYKRRDGQRVSLSDQKVLSSSQASLDFGSIPLPQLPQCWDHRCEPLNLTRRCFLEHGSHPPSQSFAQNRQAG